MILCPYCNKPAKYGANEEFYGRRFASGSGSYMCYYCKPCGAYVGTHMNSTRPLGTLANQELRNLRKKAHNEFDVLWKLKAMTRNEAYQALANLMKVPEVHIGESDIEQCKNIIICCKELQKWYL